MSQQLQQMAHWGILFSQGCFLWPTNLSAHCIKVWRAQLQLAMRRKMLALRRKMKYNLTNFSYLWKSKKPERVQYFPRWKPKRYATHTNSNEEIHNSLYHLHLVSLLVLAFCEKFHILKIVIIFYMMSSSFLLMVVYILTDKTVQVQWLKTFAMAWLD